MAEGSTGGHCIDKDSSFFLTIAVDSHYFYVSRNELQKTRIQFRQCRETAAHA